MGDRGRGGKEPGSPGEGGKGVLDSEGGDVAAEERPETGPIGPPSHLIDGLVAEDTSAMKEGIEAVQGEGAASPGLRGRGKAPGPPHCLRVEGG